MKVLIFSMTCGQGHNMIAASIAQSLKKYNVKSKIAQTFGYDEKRVALENKKFLWACKHIPHAYDFVWDKLRKKNHFTDKLPGYVKNCLPHFTKEIENYNPDIILCTHYYASSVISYMKKQHILKDNITTYTILTDYCVHPYWEHSNKVDYIIQALDNTTEDLLFKGFTKSQIITVGMPIRNEFYLEYSQIDERKNLNIPNKKTILIVGGGGGLGNTLKLLKSILSKNLNITIIIVNGNNIKNYNKISSYITKHKIKNVINLGFINNMVNYMRASDIIITRCGSSCLTESIVLQKPFIMREKMIINEKLNKELFLNLNCGIGLNKISDIGNKVEYLIKNPDIYNNMIKNIRKIKQSYSADKIASIMIDNKKDE